MRTILFQTTIDHVSKLKLKQKRERRRREEREERGRREREKERTAEIFFLSSDLFRVSGTKVRSSVFVVSACID